MTSISWATHNRAGEITYKHLSGLTYEFTITTYTKTSSIDADRDELQIFWGDGTASVLARSSAIELANNVKRNQYIGSHTYSGPFRYVVYVIDPNRVESVINMQNSVNVPFYLEDTLNILDPTVLGYNSSPILLNPPIDFGNVGEVFVHNPNAYDPDGDSLSYRLIPPKQSLGFNVPGYVSPDKIGSGPNNILQLNEKTGEIRWDAPQRQGIYNIAILITEYRNGIMVGTIVRDLQIIIQAANNQPPIIEGKSLICVVAGDVIDESYIAEDPNTMDVVTLSSNGAPYLLSINNAEFLTHGIGNPTSANFYWETNCSHLRNTDYQIVVKAEDDARIPLTDLKTVEIKVLAPAPQDFIGLYNSSSNQVELSWNELYACSYLDKFQGYSIWRKRGCGFTLDSCETDLTQFGYEKIGETASNTWIDTDLSKGANYSYLVVADFASKSQLGLLYNNFQSIASEEVCIELPLDIPLLYHVDVRDTDQSTGEIYIEWSKPDAQALDTLVNPGPYVVKLYRESGNQSELVFESEATYYDSLWDTSFVDDVLNTEATQYTYKLDFFVSSDEYLGSSDASSIFLSIIPSDSKLELNWKEDVPWENELYYIYQKQEDDTFILLDSIFSQTYLAENLSNDSTYCYKIESYGSYNRDELKDPLLNFSQIVCAQPGDTIPPCPPILNVNNFCTHSDFSKDEYVNYLTWSFEQLCTDSIAEKFYIYYKPNNLEDDYELIDSVFGTQVRQYEHFMEKKSLLGCYRIRAIDESGNISEFSEEVCVSNCPVYELPNAFTPNADGVNDLYTPIEPYSGVSRVNMKIYNRMGNLVFETNSPDINWDGRDLKSGKLLPNAVFYYVCEVYFDTLEGEQKLKKPLSGYIHLIR